MIKLFVNRGQIRLLNNNITDLDLYFSRPNQKLRFLIHDLLFVPFVKNPVKKTRSDVMIDCVDCFPLRLVWNSAMSN